MRSRDSRNEFHDFIFRQIVDGEQFFSHNAFEAFMKYAETRGILRRTDLDDGRIGDVGRGGFRSCGIRRTRRIFPRLANVLIERSGA